MTEMRIAEGIVTRTSQYSVSESLHRLTAILEERGIRVFTRIDHSGEAEKAGIEMPPMQLLIFGNPRTGTSVMLAAPLAALDLPMKVLAWADAAGNVSLSYNDPEFLRKRFGLSEEQIKPIAGIGALVDQALL